MLELLNMYKRVPLGIKSTLKSIYGSVPLKIRLPKSFYKKLAFLEESQWWSLNELENYQNEELRRLVRHAYENVPYYNNLFRALKLKPQDIKRIEDLKKLPILIKNDVRKYFNQLRAVNFKDSDIITISTGGTTGKPLQIYYEKNREYLNNEPFVWRFFGWGGHKIGELRATLSNWTLFHSRIHSYNPVRNLLILSTYNMNINNVEEYANAIKKFGIRFLDGYPSSIEFLTKNMKIKKIKRPVELEAIFSFAEYLSDTQRKMIEEFWRCKCFDRYSLEERCVLATECEKHKGLHLCLDYGITEFVKSEVPGFNKVIGTSFTNYAMPLIRYDTEDIGKLVKDKCECGRRFPLFILKGGRQKNFAIAKDNSFIPVANIDIPNVTENVLQYQFIQERKGALLLNIVRKDTFQDKDLIAIKSKLVEKFDDNMDVEIRFSDAVDRTPKHKSPIFIQKMVGKVNNGDLS